MYIKKLEIERLRCILDDTLFCEGLTALVGRNGAGKSCFLHAIRLFYAVSPAVTEEDFYNRQTGEPIQIRVTFSGLLQEEIEKFGSFMNGSDFIVTKRIYCADGKTIAKSYAASNQHPEFAKVRSIVSKKELKDAYNELVSAGTFDGLLRVTNAPDAESKMAEWEAAHPEQCVPIEREVQLLGPASVGVGSLDSYTKFVFIPAVRDVADEAGDSKGSALSALLDLVVNERVENRPELQQLRDEIKTRYEAIFAPGNHPELNELADEVSGILGDFHPGAALTLRWRKASAPDLTPPGVDPTPVEDGFPGHVSRKGHGLQRALILALLQSRAKARGPTGPTPAHSSGPEEGASIGAQPSPATPVRRQLILVIEEPELYQHPQQCRHWARVLRRITTPEDGNSIADTQVVFTTHSPHFVDISWFDQVRTIRKVPGTAGAPPVAKSHRTTLLEVAHELADITGKPVEEFTTQSARARARPVMTSLVNEGFFANLVVLVEGGTEVGLLQEVARRKGKEWDAKGVGVIDVGGKTKLSLPLVVFRKMSIPVYTVFDADAHEKCEQNKTRNRLLLKLLGVTEVDYPSEGANGTYAVVGEEMGRYLKTALGDAEFDRIADSVATDLGYEGPKKAMKNVEAAALFASRVYEESKELPLIEQIVEQITARAPNLSVPKGNSVSSAA